MSQGWMVLAARFGGHGLMLANLHALFLGLVPDGIGGDLGKEVVHRE